MSEVEQPKRSKALTEAEITALANELESIAQTDYMVGEGFKPTGKTLLYWIVRLRLSLIP
jgi:hypothetical protein